MVKTKSVDVHRRELHLKRLPLLELSDASSMPRARRLSAMGLIQAIKRQHLNPTLPTNSTTAREQLTTSTTRRRGACIERTGL